MLPALPSLPVPDVVTRNELMLECWDWATGGASHFTPADIPQLTSLAYWWAVERQCMANLEDVGGGIVTTVETVRGPAVVPDIRTMQLATNQIRQICAELGISPLARTRMGLMQAQAVTLAADLPERVFKMLDAHDGD